jgi:signal recognition particle receptor subunit beta
MARLTRDRDALVVRLVYDGPPLSGKTTSLRALADGMAREVFSPAEASGRTLFFDWLEYVGGSFEGIPIHCQIVSVPGQETLTRRRRALLAEADAVVLVINSVAAHLPAAQAHLGELRELLAAQAAPRPGLVVQANYRDQPEASPLAALRQELGLDGLALVESVATENHGIRDVFVLAVRLALDRAREQLRLGQLGADAGAADDPSALLALLKSLDGEGPPPPSPVRAEAVEPPPVDGPSGVPRLPDSSAPSGRVWPPIDGRGILHAASAPGAVPRRAADGSWWLRQGVWYFHSGPRHEFARLDDAKEELLRWAQRHSGAFERLSPQRCIALAETGWGAWRLWQVVRVEESLRQQLKAALETSSPEGVADLLSAGIARLLEARAAFAAPPPLPCRLDLIGRIGEAKERLAYIGLLPPVGWTPRADEAAITERALVEREMRPLVAAIPESSPALAEVLAAILVGVR